MAKELSKRWEVCPNKPLYEGKAQADKARYDQEMTSYRQSHNCAQLLLILNCDLWAHSRPSRRHSPPPPQLSPPPVCSARSCRTTASSQQGCFTRTCERACLTASAGSQLDARCRRHPRRCVLHT